MPHSFQPEPEDRILLERFLERSIAEEEWDHAMHVRIGWLHVKSFGTDGALQRMRSGIRHLNQAHGVPNTQTSGYHETITRLWIALIHAADQCVSAASSVAFLEEHPTLLDFDQALRHYDASVLKSSRARREWVEPNLAPLPQSLGS